MALQLLEVSCGTASNELLGLSLSFPHQEMQHLGVLSGHAASRCLLDTHTVITSAWAAPTLLTVCVCMHSGVERRERKTLTTCAVLLKG